MHDRRLFEVPEIVRPSGAPDGVRATWKVVWWPGDGWGAGCETSAWDRTKGIWRRLDMDAQPLIDFEDIAPKLSRELRALRELTPPF
jgi:hypothetical protein